MVNGVLANEKKQRDLEMHQEWAKLEAREIEYTNNTDFMTENPAEFDPRKYNAVAKDAMRDICQARYEAFGAAGMADKIKPISLEKMYQMYQTGELDPRVK